MRTEAFIAYKALLSRCSTGLAVSFGPTDKDTVVSFYAPHDKGVGLAVKQFRLFIGMPLL